MYCCCVFPGSFAGHVYLTVAVRAVASDVSAAAAAAQSTQAPSRDLSGFYQKLLGEDWEEQLQQIDSQEVEDVFAREQPMRSCAAPSLQLMLILRMLLLPLLEVLPFQVFFSCCCRWIWTLLPYLLLLASADAGFLVGVVDAAAFDDVSACTTPTASAQVQAAAFLLHGQRVHGAAGVATLYSR